MYLNRKDTIKALYVYIRTICGVIFLQTKDTVYENTQHVYTQIGGTLTHYADGGSELISTKIYEFLLSHGIHMSYTAPYCKEGNGIIERSHRTIFESAHAMLLYSHLNFNLWCYAVTYAVYIYNLIPKQTPAGFMSPHEAFFGDAPDLSQLKIFGCRVFVHIAAETRMEKGFVPKSHEGYFIGYRGKPGEGGCYAWIPQLNRVVESAILNFDETTMPAEESEPTDDEPLTIDPSPRPLEDFLWMKGMAYRDGANLYLTTRVEKMRRGRENWLVTYRAPIETNDGVQRLGDEEYQPIHCADVEKMINSYRERTQVIIQRSGGSLETCDPERGGAVGGRLAERALLGDRDSPTAPAAESAELREAGLGVRDYDRVTATDPPPRAENEVSAVVAPSATMKSATCGGEPAPHQRNVNYPLRIRTPNSVVNVSVLGNIGVASGKPTKESCSHLHCNSTEFTYYLADEIRDSVTVKEAYSSDDFPKWRAAMIDELKSICIENECLKLVEDDGTRNVITLKWVLKVKPASGRFKARLVARGFKQIAGVDYNETFAPTAKMTTFRLFLFFVAHYKLYEDQQDIKTAFLNSPIEEDIFVAIPKELTEENPLGLDMKLFGHLIPRSNRRYVHKLQKSLYGIKQAPRDWYKTMNAFLINILKLTRSQFDHCLYYSFDDSDIIMLLLYVDDLLIACSSVTLLKHVSRSIASEFKVSSMGGFDTYLGIKIERDFDAQLIFISQEAYIEQIGVKYQISGDIMTKTPLEANFYVDVEQELHDMTDHDREFVVMFPYRQIVGSLLYVAVCTRIDLSHSVSYLSRYLNNPTPQLCRASKRVVKYLLNTKSMRLKLGGSTFPYLRVFGDSDWAGCRDTRRSTGSILVFLGDCIIHWICWRQNRVADSTCVAEYMVYTPAVKEIIWCRSILAELKIKLKYATILFSDNQAAKAIAEDPVFHKRTKAIGIQYHFVREAIAEGIVAIEYIETDRNLADINTKPLVRAIFETLRDRIFRGVDIPTSVVKVRTTEDLGSVGF